jgi:hypothetical protein
MSAYSQRQKTLSYSDFVNLYNNFELVKGTIYCIPYYIEHEIPNSNGVINTSNVEHLCIEALSEQSYNTNVRSIEFSQDIIEWTHEKLYKDSFNNTLSSRGTITYRHDTIRNISAYEDFRNIVLRRYLSNSFTINGFNFFVNLTDSESSSFEDYPMIDNQNDKILNVHIDPVFSSNGEKVVSNNLIKDDNNLFISNIKLKSTVKDCYVTILDNSNIAGNGISNIEIVQSSNILLTSSSNISINLSDNLNIVNSLEVSLIDVKLDEIRDSEKLYLVYQSGTGGNLNNLIDSHGLGSNISQLENNSFNTQNLISEGFVRVGDVLSSYSPTEGDLRWNGSNFQGYKNGNWVNLDSQGTALPAGTQDGSHLKWDTGNSEWIEDQRIITKDSATSSNLIIENGTSDIPGVPTLDSSGIKNTNVNSGEIFGLLNFDLSGQTRGILAGYTSQNNPNEGTRLFLQENYDNSSGEIELSINSNGSGFGSFSGNYDTKMNMSIGGFNLDYEDNGEGFSSNLKLSNTIDFTLNNSIDDNKSSFKSDNTFTGFFRSNDSLTKETVFKAFPQGEAKIAGNDGSDRFEVEYTPTKIEWDVFSSSDVYRVEQTVNNFRFYNQIQIGGLQQNVSPVEGMVQWNGNNYQGYKNGTWVNLDEVNRLETQTLQFDYTNLQSSSNTATYNLGKLDNSISSAVHIVSIIIYNEAYSTTSSSQLRSIRLYKNSLELIPSTDVSINFLKSYNLSLDYSSDFLRANDDIFVELTSDGILDTTTLTSGKTDVQVEYVKLSNIINNQL